MAEIISDAQKEQFLQTLENFVRRYLRVKETIKELNKERKDLEDAIIQMVEGTDIDHIIVDGVVVEFENRTKIKLK
ncbi:hypothetical protein QQE94_02960 [Fervidobacterium pennivorans subsp. shakshaketiis]|jgi:hypothetical protein|uniref:Uncharacterized protein n=2 Tax=Fervidobacterium pennivorans TaxID=93466 RepID=A0A172T2K1_FERPE|nr:MULTISPECIES: hypothetical protein [Fervidobacterium]AFG34725.1 hypothetical protein Ferpe_0595 [Fervidobacterium pennivorans DSM 9078]ANE41186.1 hypothetical protein JM64_03670 [Fervidobacterium pennivorans]NPU89038.1 hypothetical protein [Fervidobacterium sp.]QIV78004.1 hypothetical protein HER11_02775 [Fervidobacterium pennivorans subsp. keratinolyticus]